MGNGVTDMTSQRILYGLNLLVSLSLGVGIGHSNIQAIFLNSDGVVSLGRNLDSHRDLVLVRDGNLSSRSSQAGVDRDVCEVE